MSRLLPVLLLLTICTGTNATSNFKLFTDSIPPPITCPPSVTLTLKPAKCDTAYFYNVLANDNEPGFNLTRIAGLGSGSKHPIGVTVNQWRVIDAAGNTAACSFSVTVLNGMFPLLCKNAVSVSLDAITCSATLQASSLLDPPYSCLASYLVELDKTPPSGNGPWVPGVLGPSDLGKTIQYRVSSMSSGFTCVGNVLPKDLAPPQIVCETIMLPCGAPDFTPDYLKNVLKVPTAYPQITENCGGVVDTSFLDTQVGYHCDSAFYKVINRRWTATDVRNNSSTCVQQIRLLRPTMANIKLPADVTLSCPDTQTTPAQTGQPHWLWLGFQFTNLCSFDYIYADTLQPLCGGSRRIKRTWQIVNWCASTVATHRQNIDIQDDKAPSIACPVNPVVSAAAINCFAVVNLPDVVITDGCSKLTGVKAYWTSNGKADSLIGTLTNFPANNPLQLDTLGLLGIDSLFPAGETVVQYVATDACGNKGSCTALVAVWDQQPPVAKCDSLLLRALDADGVITVDASALNKGSTDNCSPVRFKARRKVAANGCQPNPKFDDRVTFCCEDSGDTVLITLRVYDVAVPPDTVLDNFAMGQFSDCTARVRIVDGFQPACTAPPDVTVACKDFDPTLAIYGPVASLTCRVDSLLIEIDSSNFQWLCRQGTLARKFHTFSANGLPGGTCTQKIKVEYEQNYYVKFPDDRIITVCDGKGNYGEPEFFGRDCEQMHITFKDLTFTVVPDACYKVERTWTIINWCSYNPNLPLTNVPNPNPNVQINHASNLPGPVVSASSDPNVIPLPWTATKLPITPTAPVKDFSSYWAAATNGYTYKQIIKVIDTHDPVVVSCPLTPISVGDQTSNDPLFWNKPYWLEMSTGSQDMREAPVNLSATITDACSGSGIDVKYLLYLDLDGNNTMETVVSSSSPPGPNNVNFNNINSPNFGGGVPRTYDERPVPANEKYSFALQTFTDGPYRTARVVWNTPIDPITRRLPQLPYGKHRIKWIATDNCGNERVCDYVFSVGPGPLPPMSCDSSFKVVIAPQNFGTLLLSTVLPSVLDHATPSALVQFGIRKSGTGTGFPANSTSLNFGCSEIGEHTVEIWARDPDGLVSTCNLPVRVVDLENHCNNVTPKYVGGFVKTEVNQGLAQAVVQLQSPVFASVPVVLTDTSGAFNFASSIPYGSPYEVIPAKDVAPLNGVTTFDLVLISKHILGLEPITSPYRLIAADANRSGSVTTFDIVEFRKLILGIYTVLPANTSWRFVDKKFVFPEPSNPFKTSFPEKINVANILEDSLNHRFVALKVGDINHSAVVNALTSTDDRGGNAGTLFFDLENKIVQPGEVIELKLQPSAPALGYQFTLEHAGLELLEIQPGTRLSADHFGLFEDALTVSCEVPTTGSADAATAFTVRFRAETSGLLRDLLRISDRITRAEGYPLAAGNSISPHRVDLRFQGQQASAARFELFQNRPNPFSRTTSISFCLPQAAPATLTVFDGTGQVLFLQKKDFTEGCHTMQLDAALLVPKSAGVLYYRLETPTHSAVRRMVVVRS